MRETSSEWMTLVQAGLEGIDISDAPPFVECQFCHKTLFHKVFCLPEFHFKKYSEVPERCNCPASQRAWSLIDAEEKKCIEQENEARRRVAMQDRITTLYAQSCLGPRFRQRTFVTFKDNSNTSRAKKAAYEFATKFEVIKPTGKGLLITGGYGTGKTHLAAAIANSLLGRGIPCVFGTLGELLDKFKATYSGEIKGSEISLLDLYSTVDLLVIDDLGKERVSEWTMEKLWRIINNRYENLLPVVVTTNYTMSQLSERMAIDGNPDYIDAVTDRFRETCMGVIISGESYRGR